MRFLGLEISREKRASANPFDDRYYLPFQWNNQSAAGTKVNPETAAKMAVVYMCVNVLSQTLGSIPLILYKRKGETRDRATEHPLYNILRMKPNQRQTAIEFREFMVASYLLTGNAYAYIRMTGLGVVTELQPLNPMAVTPVLQKNGGIVYELRNAKDNTVRLIQQYEMLHIKLHSADGVVGKSPISHFVETLGLDMTMEEFEGNFYANNAAPSGVLQMGADQDLSPKAIERVREEWKKKYEGPRNAGGIALLEEGMTWHQIGIPAQDAQFLDSKRFTERKIHGCFRVPAHLVNDLERATFNNIEQMGIDFLQHSMMPHFVRWEQAISTQLLGEREQEKYFAEFLIDGLQRADILSRHRSYAIGRQWGWLSVNDIRNRENMNPVDGGDVYLQPMNMIDAEDADQLLDKEKVPGTKNEIDDNSNPTVKKTARADLALRAALPMLIDSRNEVIVTQVRALLDEVKSSISDVKAELLSKIEVKPPEIAPIVEEKKEDIPSPTFWRVRAAAVSVFAETLSRMMVKERNALKTLRKKNPLADESYFYNEHLPIVREALSPAVENYCEQVRFFASTQKRDSISEEHIHEAINLVLRDLQVRYQHVYADAGERIEEYSRHLAIELASMVEGASTSSKIISDAPEKKSEPPTPTPPPPAPTTNVVVQVEQPPERKKSREVTPFTTADGSVGYRVHEVEVKDEK